VCLDLKLLAWGSWRQANEKKGILCDWLGVHIWLSLVGPKLEVGTELGEVVINQVLAILDRLLQKLLFGFLDCYRRWRQSDFLQIWFIRLASWHGYCRNGIISWASCCRLWRRVLFYIQSSHCPFVYSGSHLFISSFIPFCFSFSQCFCCCNSQFAQGFYITIVTEWRIPPLPQT